jgi:hypothetical protein
MLSGYNGCLNNQMSAKGVYGRPTIVDRLAAE